MRHVLFATAMLAALAVPVLAAGADEQPSVAILVHESGVDAAFSSMGGWMRDSAIAQNKETHLYPDDFIDVGAKALQQSFSKFGLVVDLLLHLKGRISDDQVREMLVFYRSDLGKRVVAARIAIMSSEGVEFINTRGEALAKSLRDEPLRLEALKLINEQRDCQEDSLSAAAEWAVASAVELAKLVGDRTPDLATRTHLRAEARRKLLAKISDRCLVATASEMQHLSVNDLRQVVNFMKTDAYQAYGDEISATILRFYIKAATNLTKAWVGYVIDHPEIATEKSL